MQLLFFIQMSGFTLLVLGSADSPVKLQQLNFPQDAFNNSLNNANQFKQHQEIQPQNERYKVTTNNEIAKLKIPSTVKQKIYDHQSTA